MPDMDGFDTYRALRQFEDSKGRPRIPVIFLTGENGSAGAVCEMASADIDRFVQGVEQSDDITMLCIRYLGEQ